MAMSESRQDHIQRIIEECGVRLSEQCESVLILATCKNGDMTERYAHNAGNVYASLGAAREYIVVNDARVYAHAIKEK